MFHAGHSGGCGINDDVIQWMNDVQNSAIEDDDVHHPKHATVSQKLPLSEAKRKHKKVPIQSSSTNKLNYEDKFSKYSKVANEDDSFRRHKRATRQEENKNTCSLYIQTDPLIWKHIREGFPEVKAIFFRAVIVSLPAK